MVYICTNELQKDKDTVKINMATRQWDEHEYND